MTAIATRAIGSSPTRVEGTAKVTGAARYSTEQDHLGEVAYLWPVAATIAKGRIDAIDRSAAAEWPGVLAVLTPDNAPRLATTPDDPELAVLQDHEVSYRGQFVAAVVAASLETAREAAARLQITYAEAPHDSELTEDHPKLYTPETVNPAFPSDTEDGDVDAALAKAAITVDATYRTPPLHNNPMEPHASLAVWLDGELTLYDSLQGAFSAQQTLAKLFELPPASVHVINEHVGGGFGSKGTVRVGAVLAAMAARQVCRPVTFAMGRNHMFTVVGYRTPTIQRVRLGANAEGRLEAIDHAAIEQTSTVLEFAEQTTVATRIMYAAGSRRTAHRLAALDVPTPRWMRAPGECPGMFALESAMDELAVAAGLDPVELRIRNEPDVEPESGKPFSSRSLVACLREGAARFGWADRDRSATGSTS